MSVYFNAMTITNAADFTFASATTISATIITSGKGIPAGNFPFVEMT